MPQKPSSSSSSSSSSTTPTPKNWPPHLRYLRSPSYSPTLTPSHHTTLHTKPPSSSSFYLLPAHTPKGPHPHLKITPITHPSHPAFRQAGLFATHDLPPGSFILEYLGVIHPCPTATATGPSPGPSIAPDPHATSDYDLSLCRFSDPSSSPSGGGGVGDGNGNGNDGGTGGMAIDAARAGNEARFINDYRGVAARPNAEFCEVWSEGRGERGMGVWVLGAGKGRGKRNGRGDGRERGIRKGEEIVVSYGKGFWGSRREEAAKDGVDEDGALEGK